MRCEINAGRVNNVFRGETRKCSGCSTDFWIVLPFGADLLGLKPKLFKFLSGYNSILVHAFGSKFPDISWTKGDSNRADTLHSVSKSSRRRIWLVG